jgi:hypothetical protein
MNTHNGQSRRWIVRGFSRVKAVIKKWRKDLCPKGEDRIWSQWLDLKNRERRDLVELLTSDCKDSFKVRALLLLLLPHKDLHPFRWDFDLSCSSWHSYHGLSAVKLEGSTRDLLERAAELVVVAMQDLSERRNAVREFREELWSLNSYLLQLMVLMPDKALQLLEYYQLNDTNSFSNMDDSSGYNPLLSLWWGDVPEEIKVAADTEMRAVILSEAAGETTPREDWEEALPCYWYHITIQLHRKEGLVYDAALLVSQIQFVLSLPGMKGRRLISNFHVSPLWNYLSGEQNKKLRHQFARFVLFENGEPFSIYDSNTHEAAVAIQTEFGTEDPEINQLVDRALRDYYEREAKQTETQAAQAIETEAVLSQMRAS